MGIDTNILLIQSMVTDLLTKTRFLVMAALICILRKLPKDDRVASFRFLKSTYQRYRNSQKTLYGPYCTLIGLCHRTIWLQSPFWHLLCPHSHYVGDGANFWPTEVSYMDTVYNVLLEPTGCWLTVGIRVRLWAAVILHRGRWGAFSAIADTK